VHVREPGFGVTVANESSYGYQVARRQSADGRPMTVVRASLLRASTFPDPQADHGRHSFRFSLRPATDIVDAVAEGHRLCDPVFSLPAPVSIEPLVTVASREVIVDTVKSAEDGTGDVILRLYEATGSRQSTRLAFGLPVTSVREATIYEEPGHLVSTEDELVFAPFQIRTLRIAFARR
jgi:alpha-mannosidase